MEQCVEARNDEYVQNDFDRLVQTSTSPHIKKTFLYIQEVGRMGINKQCHTDRVNLDSLLFVLVLEGKGLLTYKGRTFNLSKDCCFFIDCMNSHSYESNPNDPWKILWVHFNGSTARGYYQYFEELFVNVIKPSNVYPFQNVLERILDINQKRDAYTEIKTSKLLTDLITLALTFKQNDMDYTVKEAQTLNKVKDYIDNNFFNEIYLEDLCKQFCMSKFYLTKEFKKVYGITISRYIISCRINHAKKLLRFTNKPIDEISFMCGFYDTSYFNRQFKAIEEITPFKYRKTWRDSKRDIE